MLSFQFPPKNPLTILYIFSRKYKTLIFLLDNILLWKKDYRKFVNVFLLYYTRISYVDVLLPVFFFWMKTNNWL